MRTAYLIRFHPSVPRDLQAIAEWISAWADADAADRKLAEIIETIESLGRLPHQGSRRDDVLPGLRAVPAGRKAVIAFSVDDATSEVLVYAVSYGGADWMTRSRERR